METLSLGDAYLEWIMFSEYGVVLTINLNIYFFLGIKQQR
jgi:hypothetical protein